MPRVRYDIGGEIEVLSPMHVGNGETRTLGAIGAPAAGKPAPEIAAVQRDARGRPFLPGTTLKGLLRRIAEADGADAVAPLFGTITDAQGGGAMGAVLVRGAAEIRPGSAEGMPYAASCADELGPGVFVAARTRVDRHSGTAADNKLHFAEMVVPGARYRFAATLERRSDTAPAAAVSGEAAALLEAFLAVLARLTDAAGWPIGKGQADGQGRVRLDGDTVRIVQRKIGPDGVLGTADATALWSVRTPARTDTDGSARTITLTCPGPFLIADSSHRPQRDANGDSVGPQVAAQRRGDLALLLGSSVTGALRARAAWLVARQRHRDGLPLPSSRKVDDPDRPFAGAADIAKLEPVERLFGVTGFRALLDLRSLEILSGRPARFTSVKLDRFSGAPIDNALFKTDAFVGTTLRFTLALSARPGVVPSDADRALYDRLTDDLLTNGIVLGHGGNAGFGWFEPAR